MKLPQPSSIAKSASQNHWTWLQRTQPFSWIQNLFNITDSEAMLNAQTLNYLKYQMKLDMPLSFVCQSRMHDEAQYYEQIIFSQGIVPTRPNSWHDFYNGVIWLQFPKTKRLLNRWHVEDIEQFELNEAFASQSLAVIRELGLNPEIVNVNGGAIALGHPLGCTGGKLTVQLINEMKRRNQKYGMVTMCVGAGQGAAGVFEIL